MLYLYIKRHLKFLLHEIREGTLFCIVKYCESFDLRYYTTNMVKLTYRVYEVLDVPPEIAEIGLLASTLRLICLWCIWMCTKSQI